MSAIHSQASVDSERHSSKPLDETVWRMWLKKNLLEERRRAAGRIKAVNWVCIGVLMAAMLVSSYVSTSYVSTYQAMVRLAIGLGGTVMLFESLRTRQYVSAALFAGLVVLFNPVFPTFALSANWPILVASMLPFFASLGLDEGADSEGRRVSGQEHRSLTHSCQTLYLSWLSLAAINVDNGLNFTYISNGGVSLHRLQTI